MKLPNYVILGGIISLFAMVAFAPAAYGQALVNHAPVFSSTPITVIVAGEPYSYSLKAYDADGDTLAFTLTTGPQDITLSKANVLEWTPTTPGLYNVVLEVTDQKGGFASQAFQITVTTAKLSTLIITPNDRPTIVDLGERQQFAVKGYDTFGNQIEKLNVVWSTDSTYGTIDQAGMFVANRGGISFVASQQEGVKTSIGVVVKAIPAIAPEKTPAAAKEEQKEAGPSTVQGIQITEEPTKQPEQGEEPATTTTTAESGPCQNWPTWLIILSLVLYGVLLLAYYFFARKQKSPWWWIAPALLTIFGIILFFVQFCENTYLWWPWTLLGIGVVLTAGYYYMRRKSGLAQTRLPF